MFMSTFGVAIPLLLFFWKQCRTNTASANFTVQTARYVPPASSSTTSSTAEALEHLRRIILVAHLCQRQRVAEASAHVGRQRHQILVTARDPFERFFFIDHDGSLYLFR